MSKRIKDPKHLGRVAALCCIICRKTGLADDSPACCHHSRHGQGLSQRADDMEAYPLCHFHHQGKEGIHTLGTKAWERKYWPESQLLAETLEELGL